MSSTAVQENTLLHLTHRHVLLMRVLQEEESGKRIDSLPCNETYFFTCKVSVNDEAAGRHNPSFKRRRMMLAAVMKSDEGSGNN